VTVRSWRIVKAKYEASAFTGVGAQVFGGRWHSIGTKVVYTAGSASLAVLELLVHLKADELFEKYGLCEVAFPEGVVEDVDVARLPTNWRGDPPPPQLYRIGDSWIVRRSSAVLRVPSAIVELEFNYLLNPAHPNFGRIDIGPFVPYRIDPRLRK
jgi:RES domain-containing protein